MKLSKLLALIIFVTFPIVGFILGTRYQATMGSSNTDSQEDLSIIARRLYTANLEKLKLTLEPYIENRFTDFKIESIKIQPNADRSQFCFEVSYSLKPFNFNKYTPAGNGEMNQMTGWIEDKYAQVMVKKSNEEYVIKEEGTGGVCGSSIY